MSECQCGIDFNHKLMCGQGKTLMHVEDHEAELEAVQNELIVAKEKLEDYRLRDIKAQNEENETLNHLRVEQSQHQVRLTLRGKSKMFTPKAIKDLISKLQVMAENAESYEPSAMIHCSSGLDQLMDFRGPLRMEK